MQWGRVWWRYSWYEFRPKQKPKERNDLVGVSWSQVTRICCEKLSGLWGLPVGDSGPPTELISERTWSLSAVDSCQVGQVRFRKRLRAAPSRKLPFLCSWLLGTLGPLTSRFSYLSLSLLNCKMGLQ